MDMDDVGSVRPHPPAILSMHISSPSTRTYKQIKVKIKQSRYRPGVAQRVSGS
jgi:hypothetical protein